MIYKHADLSFAVSSQATVAGKSQVQFSTQDRNSAKLIFKFFEGRAPLNLVDVTPELTMIMDDGSKFVVTPEVTENFNGVMEYTLKPNEIRHYGRVSAELTLKYPNDKTIGGFEFGFTIKQAMVDRNNAPLKEYYVQDLETIKKEVQSKADSVYADIDTFKAGMDKKTSDIDKNLTAFKTNIDSRTAVVETKVNSFEANVAQKTVIQVDAAKKDTTGQTHADLDSRIKADIGRVNTQLVEMPTKGYVNSLAATLASGSPKGVYSQLSDLQTAFPNGNSNIYLVNGHWYYWNSNKPNLFNKDTVTMGQFVINGVPTASNSTAALTDFIPVIPGQQLWITRIIANDGGAFYDQNKTFISKIAGDGTNILTVPSGASIMRLNISTAVSPLNTFMILNNQATGFWDDGGVYQATEIQEKSVTPNKIESDLFDKINLVNKDRKITPDVLYNRATNNLFDKNTVTNGYYLINGVPTASGNNRFSDYIRVTPGSTIRGTAFLTTDGGAFYDKNLKFLSKITADSSTKISVPANAYYMRINISSGVNLDRLMVNEGADLLPFQHYGVGVINGLLSYTDNLFSKKMLTIGDSITWLDGNTATIDGVATTMVGYQEQFRKVGAIVTNKGNSGATYRQYVAGISDMNHGSLYDDIVTNQFDVTPYDIITLFAGTNDVGRGFNLGSVGNIDDSTFDPKTTLGALRGIIEYIRTNNADCEIYIMTPIRSGLSTRPFAKMEQMADGIKTVSHMYGIPCIDLLREGGVGKGNYGVYLYDDLHPNNKGFELIGKRMVRYINAK